MTVLEVVREELEKYQSLLRWRIPDYEEEKRTAAILQEAVAHEPKLQHLLDTSLESCKYSQRSMSEYAAKIKELEEIVAILTK